MCDDKIVRNTNFIYDVCVKLKTTALRVRSRIWSGLIYASCVCDTSITRTTHGFGMASCRIYIPFMRETKSSSEVAEFKECVCACKFER